MVSLSSGENRTTRTRGDARCDRDSAHLTRGLTDAWREATRGHVADDLAL
jgi:hypothetical protein